MTETIATFTHLPDGYVQQIEAILACPGSNAGELAKSVSDLEQAWRSVVTLPGVEYRPKFQV